MIIEDLDALLIISSWEGIKSNRVDKASKDSKGVWDLAWLKENHLGIVSCLCISLVIHSLVHWEQLILVEPFLLGEEGNISEHWSWPWLVQGIIPYNELVPSEVLRNSGPVVDKLVLEAVFVVIEVVEHG